MHLGSFYLGFCEMPNEISFWRCWDRGAMLKVWRRGGGLSSEFVAITKFSDLLIFKPL